MRLWKVATSEERLKLPKCRAFVISSTGKVICLTRSGVVLYNLIDGKEFVRLQEPLHYPNALAISPDGRSLAIGHTKGFIRLVDLQNLSESMPTTGHRGPVLSLAYAARTASGWLRPATIPSASGTAAPAKRNACWRGPAFGVNAVAVAPDGKTIAFGQDHDVQLVSTDNLAADRAVRRSHERECAGLRAGRQDAADQCRAHSTSAPARASAITRRPATIPASRSPPTAGWL